jgi:hypothetical protein
MYGCVSPYGAVDNASHQVFDLVCCDQCAVNQCQEYRDSRLLRETKGLRAIDSQADPVKGFVERVEEVEKCAALPGLEINLNGTGTILLRHDSIVYAPKQISGGILLSAVCYMDLDVHRHWAHSASFMTQPTKRIDFLITTSYIQTFTAAQSIHLNAAFKGVRQ